MLLTVQETQNMDKTLFVLNPSITFCYIVNLDKGVKDNHIVGNAHYFHLIKIEVLNVPQYRTVNGEFH